MQFLSDFKSKSLITHAEKVEEYLAKLPAIEKGYKPMGDEDINVSTGNVRRKTK